MSGANGYLIVPTADLAIVEIHVVNEGKDIGGVTMDKPGVAEMISQLTTWHGRMVDPPKQTKQ